MADIIDINVVETVEEVTINVVDNVIQVNINKVTSIPTLEEVLIAGNTATDLSITLDNTVGITSTYIDSEQILISDNVSNESSSINPLLIGVSDNTQSISVFKNRISRYKSNFVSDITFTDPTANRNITFKDASGTIALTSDIPAPITIDATPTDGSTNAVSSNGVFDALALKQDTLVSATNIKTINGSSVLGSGDLVVSGASSLTVGTSPITSGTIGRVFFQGTGNVLQQSASLFWDDTNSRLGVGATPASTVRLDVRAQGALSTDIAFRVRNSADTADVFTVRGNGNVGIGAAPALGFTFHVQGSARVTSTFQSDGNATFFGAIIANSQIRMGPNPAASSSLLDIQSTTQGFLPPRMTTTQKNAIASPVAGLVVYDNTLGKLCVRTASAWETITSL